MGAALNGTGRRELRVAVIAANDSLQDVLTWRVHPARHRLRTTCFVFVIIGALAWLSADLMNDFWWAVIACLVVGVSLRNFLLPGEFRIDSAGVSVRRLAWTRCYPWRDVRRFLHDANGGFISPRARSSVMDLFRGMHLVFDGNRELVVAAVERSMRVSSTCNDGRTRS
jgi:hypothetical protein